MNLQNKRLKSLLFLVGLVALSTISCQEKNDSEKITIGSSEFEEPKVIPLEFSEPKQIDWEVRDMNDFAKMNERKVNIESFPRKPFYPDRFIPLKTPLKTNEVLFESFMDSSLNFSELPSIKIDFKNYLLANPKKIKAGLPKIEKNSTLGILEFSEDQGLPSYLVTALMEDSNGMMWIATDKGLTRFDGAYLEIFDFIESFFTGSQAIVNNILEDQDGRIWVYTSQKGIYVLDLKVGLVSSFNFVGQNFNFNDNCSMIMDGEGQIWVGTIQDGIYVFNSSDDTYKHIPQWGPNNDRNASKLTIDQNGSLWVGSASGLSEIDIQDGKIKTLEEPFNTSIASITGLFTDSENQIWIGTAEQGVAFLNSERNIISSLGAEQGLRTSICHFSEGSDQTIWMSSSEGVYVFNKDNNGLKNLNSADGLIDDFINTTTFDRNEQLWIATQDGINLFDLKGLAPIYLNSSDGLSGPDTWSFFEDSEERLWIGSRQGLDLYDPSKNSISRLDINLGLPKANNISHKMQRLSENQILITSPGFGFGIYDEVKENIQYLTGTQGIVTLFPSSSIVDSKGRLWTGSFRNGDVEFIDLEKKEIKMLSNLNGIMGDIVWGFAEDRYGQIWAGTDLGINVINPENNTISYLMEEGELSQRNTGAFFKDEDEKLWIGSRSGLLIVDQYTNSLTEINTENGLSNPAVYTSYGSNGKYYIGTGNGFNLLTPNPEKKSQGKFGYDLKSFEKGQGLIYTDFNADAVIEFNNKLWWGIETEALTITNIPRKDSSEIKTFISGITISDESQIFFDRNNIARKRPDLDTIFSASLDTFYLANAVPKQSDWLQENHVKWDSVSGYFNLPVNLEIPFEHNYLSFQFSSAQLSNQDKAKFSYFLEGFDKEWSKVSTNPFSENYRNLPAGKYTFLVSSLSPEGLWIEPAKISFTILPHWTNTWWAWVLYLLAFSAIVGAIVQYRAKALKKENLILEEKVKHRTSQLNQSLENLKSTQAQLIQSEKMASLGELTAGIAHEIQNPLNFVNNFSELNKELIAELKEEIKKGDLAEVKLIATDIEANEDKIHYHGKRAGDIVKGMLEHSRSNSGEKVETDLNELADEYLRLSYHGLRAKDKSFTADFKLDLDPDLPKVDVVASDIGRVVLNLVNNAFYAVHEKAKSTPLPPEGGETYKPLVTVKTMVTKSPSGDLGVELSVQDNGNGIPESIKDKIFQPFFTSKPTGSGTGLGLSLSYDIIKAHGGEIRIESEEGMGATFVMSIPNNDVL
ncbi:sensor histidine kinase [Algoriphagus sediminis]|uniref:histidine kinase n=1 Tax=Algoriphagus sediminis TaxID=3057113 RepID=A0ABT7YC54_9BACT|nr:sensor histidine kinase [Algoriphagus sediminis]MDN3204100.1 two-component regulator propeller domain-containing protein [Algoriphagus sediminis]